MMFLISSDVTGSCAFCSQMQKSLRFSAVILAISEHDRVGEMGFRIPRGFSSDEIKD